jgi:hypothetical protein
VCVNSVLKSDSVLALQDLANEFIAMSMIDKESAQALDEFVMGPSRILRDIAVNTVGCQMIGYAFRVMVIPSVKITIYEIDSAHR